MPSIQQVLNMKKYTHSDVTTQLLKESIMPIDSEKIVAVIPLQKVFRLIGHLLAFAKGGISREEGEILLEDLAGIAAAIAGKLAK
jgi:hypothetical protein